MRHIRSIGSKSAMTALENRNMENPCCELDLCGRVELARHKITQVHPAAIRTQCKPVLGLGLAVTCPAASAQICKESLKTLTPRAGDNMHKSKTRRIGSETLNSTCHQNSS